MQSIVEELKAQFGDQMPEVLKILQQQNKKSNIMNQPIKVRKKPVVVEAISFEGLVEYGKTNDANIVNGMPWSFEYAGHWITHETDDCYLIPTLEGTMKMSRGDMLITGVKGEIYPCKRDIFDATYETVENQPAPSPAKTLHNSDISGARKNVPDIKVFGNGDTFKLLCKASSEREGWLKSTKVCPIQGNGHCGCIVQVTTQQKNPDGSYSVAEALTFVPGAMFVPGDGSNPPQLVFA